MAMRMVTIFVALIVCGMFFPGLARGEDLRVDQGLDVDFEEVVIGEEKTIPLQITNQSEYTLTLIPTFNKDADCDFTCYKIVNDEPTQLRVTYLEPGEVLNLEVTFIPSAEGLCTAWLDIMYTGSPGGAVRIDFTAHGKEESTQTFLPIALGGFPTSVMDRPIEIDEHTTSTLQEMIDECEEKFERRGQLMRCVAWMTGELCRAGDITRKEKRELRRFAAKVEWRKIIEKMKARKKTRNGHRGGGRYWWLCRGR